MSTRLTKQRLRIIFEKQGALRFIGHLDIAKTWERILRRAQWPLEYTQGFNRHPRIQFADTLPLGFTSEGEILDVWLEERVPVSEELISQLKAVSPAHLKTLHITEVEITSPSLPTVITGAVYFLQVMPPGHFPVDMAERVERVLGADELIRTRGQEGKLKTYDLRPLIQSIDLVDNTVCRVIMSLGEGQTGRPQELLKELALDKLPLRIHRQSILLRND